MYETSLRLPLFIDGCRTPYQRAGTGFRDQMSYQLGAAAIQGLLQRNELPAEAVDRVVLGSTVPNPRTTNVAREAALAAGLPASVPALTMTAAGVSATVALGHGLDLIATGQAEVVIAGGTDCISDPPILFRRAMRQKLLAARRVRGIGPMLSFLLSLRPWDFVPDLPDITEFSTGQTMGEFTEELVQRLGIGREAQDAYALRSHQRAAAARRAGYLAAEIVEVPIAGQAPVREDNGIRENSTAADLAALRPAFDRESGTLTAGNSSFLTDGASVVLLMSEAAAERLGKNPRARFEALEMTAHDPREELLLGPVFATARVLERTGHTLEDLEVLEIHEAFAGQVLAVLHCLASPTFAAEHLGRSEAVGKIDENRLNAWGGSLALGNPFAPNGARLVTTAVHRLAHHQASRALVATCAGGGLGHAIVLERIG